MKSDSYIALLKPQEDFPTITSKVLYVRDVDSKNLATVHTVDCPDDYFSIRIPEGSYKDVSESMLNVNLVIPPKHENTMFSCSTARVYRNYLGSNSGIEPILNPEDSIGKLCLIGIKNKSQLKFNKVGILVYDVDDNYVIGCAGYCEPITSDAKPRYTTCCISIHEENKFLFNAADVVNKCNSIHDANLNKLREFKDVLANSFLRNASEGSPVYNTLQRMGAGW